MKLYLHIGTEKTGTTSIQECLFQNRGALAAAGFHFLQCAGTRNNRALPCACMNDAQADDFFLKRRIITPKQRAEFRETLNKALKAELRALPSSIHSVVISSENFHSRTSSLAEVLRVHDMLIPFFSSVNVICYLREQSALCLSSYSTVMRSGGNEELGEFLKRCTPDNIYYNYHDMLGNWAEVFGRENLRVRIFSRERFRNRNLLQDFLALLDEGLCATVPTDLEARNESLTPFGLMVARAVNKAFPKYSGSGVPNQTRARAIQAVTAAFTGGGAPLPPEKYKEIYESFAPSNALVNERYLGDEGNPFPFEEPENAPEVMNAADAEGLTRVLLAVAEPNLGLPDKCADLFVETALSMERSAPDKANMFMGLAFMLRPDNALIHKKLLEYKRKQGKRTGK